MDYQATIRYGKKTQSYSTLLVSARDMATALRMVAEEMSEEVAKQADLVELRSAPDFEKRFPETTDP